MNEKIRNNYDERMLRRLDTLLRRSMKICLSYRQRNSYHNNGTHYYDG